jgi:hypothetical protein
MQNKLLVLCLIMLVLGISNPAREQHEDAYRDDVKALSEQIIADENINPLYRLGGLFAKDFSELFVKVSHYHDYYFFSVLSMEDENSKREEDSIMTIGFLGYIYVNIDHEKVKEMLDDSY